MRSQRTKSGNGRTYSAPCAEVTHSSDGVSGEGPTLTQIIALFSVLPFSFAFNNSEDEDVECAFAEVAEGGFGAEKGLGKFVVIWGWKALSKWG